MVTSNPGQIPAPYIRCITALIGFYPELEAAKLLLSQNLIELPKTLEDIHSLWKVTADKCAQLQSRLNPSPYLQTTYELDQYEKKLKAWPVYQRNFAKVDYHLQMVRVEELIPVQWYLDLDYCHELISIAPRPGASSEKLFNFIYEEKNSWQRPRYDQASGCRALIIPDVTPNIDARFTEIKDSGADTFLATTQIRPSFNYLHVAHIKRSHLVILNGSHHACALHQVGWKLIPCLVRKANNIAEAGFPPGQAGVLPEDRILNSRRPPYLRDYFDEEIAPRFHQHVIRQCSLQLQPVIIPFYNPPKP